MLITTSYRILKENKKIRRTSTATSPSFEVKVIYGQTNNLYIRKSKSRKKNKKQHLSAKTKTLTLAPGVHRAPPTTRHQKAKNRDSPSFFAKLAAATGALSAVGAAAYAFLSSVHPEVLAI